MKIEELERLCSQATPGPWKYDWGNWEVEGDYPGRPCICDFPDEKNMGSRFDAPQDGEFIAASRELMPKLLAVAKAAKACNQNKHLIDTVSYAKYELALMVVPQELEK